MASAFGFRSTMTCLRRARVTIPRLSPTHTKATIVRFCPPGIGEEDPPPRPVSVECTNALFILECSPDVVAEGFREQSPDGSDVSPLMIVESHEEGDFVVDPSIRLGKSYEVGKTIGWIDDGDDCDNDDDDNWLWQAYCYEENPTGRELNLPPHIATGKISIS
mmetsp:Transcript_15107/g.35033  ORF Transcript_15107/g.35033 Transcript_15107/m.35033 type:complete len:163 (-) Transcript_15107:344-832(-)